MKVNPYNRLALQVREWTGQIIAPKTRNMFYYDKRTLDSVGYNLTDLYHRTEAAQQLGFEVQLTADEKGLHVKYVQKRPDSFPFWLP